MMIINNKEQLTTVAKRIQTRLSKQGVKVSLGDIKPICEAMITEINNPLPEEMDLVVNHFLDNPVMQIVEAKQDLSVSAKSENTDNQLTKVEQNKIVATAAHQMGIVLNANEIATIAHNLNDSTNTFESDIAAIKQAILAFVQHKSLIAQGQIQDMIAEVRTAIGSNNRKNSELLSSELSSISDDIHKANTDFKSAVTSALAAFTIPSGYGNQTI